MMRAAMLLSIRDNVAIQFLEFIGIQDATVVGRGILWYFNVLDDAHPKYKSTVAISIGGTK